MDVRQPAEAGKAFEKLFAAGDLEGLMELYEPDAVFTNARGAHAGSVAIRNVLQGYLDTGASIRMNESVAFEAGDLALVHWSWTMAFPDGRTAEGATAEVLRKSTDGTWKFVIDNPDGPALIGHA
ncbi:MAG TPA: nuclear transport factor 2 family protein [Woeseiaceae bacterium]|nr:nuclear transport factor 2 family protein [Woeseiaceae bacterium]